jgi:N-acetylglutamate synthase-like GNAT family acetyltransferase
MYAKHKLDTKDKQNIIFRKAVSQSDIEMVHKMGKCWFEDYLAAGDNATSYGTIPQFKKTALKGLLVLVIVDNNDAGFAALKVCEGKTVINVVYVSPSFRQKGIAKALYQYLINQCGASEIELTYRRVLDRIDYWKSVGFESLKSKDGYFLLGDLCRLSVVGTKTRLFSVALNKEDIQRYRRQKGVTLNINVHPLDLIRFTNF